MGRSFRHDPDDDTCFDGHQEKKKMKKELRELRDRRRDEHNNENKDKPRPSVNG